jgi:hypothetical protein
MNTTLWCLQGFLAATFLYSGLCKAFLPREKLVAIGQTGVDGLSYAAIRAIAVLELLGVAGIILPGALHILQVLVPVTAFCFAVVMVFAMRIHAGRKEWKAVVFNGVVFCVSMFVAYKRAAGLPGSSL